MSATSRKRRPIRRSGSTRFGSNDRNDLGKSLGFRVSASECDTEDAEWLYDMVWATMDGNVFTDQAMVMESEWGTRIPIDQQAAVNEDFQKLVQARAAVRVWVYTAANEEIARKHIENCKTQIRRFSGSSPDDRYLLILLIWSKDDFITEIFP